MREYDRVILKLKGVKGTKAKFLRIYCQYLVRFHLYQPVVWVDTPQAPWPNCISPSWAGQAAAWYLTLI